jgi:TPR repeat protein
MRKSVKAFNCMTRVVFFLLGSVSLAEDQKPIVAVFGIENRGVQLDPTAISNLSDFLAAEIASTGSYEVVPRAQIKERLSSEKKNSFRACYEQSCQIEIGRELAASKSVSTQLLKIGKKCVVTATLFDLKKATAERAITQEGFCTAEGVMETLQVVAGKLLGETTTKVAVVTCRVDDPKDCMAKCDQNQAESCHRLANQYEFGKGVAKDAPKAVALYRKACDGGSMNGCVGLGNGYRNAFGGLPKDLNQALALYKKACDAGFGDGCTELGWRHWNGEGVPADRAQATQLFSKACDLGGFSACAQLGWHHRFGNSVTVDQSKALLFFQKACEGGNAHGCEGLGWQLMDVPETKDFTNLLAVFQKAADGGAPGAWAGLGWVYRYGRGVPADQGKALSFFKKSCDGGSAAGCTGMGWQTKDVPETRDYPKAVAAFQKGGDGRDNWGWVGLGWAYRFGQGVSADQGKALSYFQKACDLGCWGGCEGLGWQQKDVVETRDFAKAVSAFQKAGDMGSACAWSGLGWAHRYGQGVPADQGKALSYFQKACDKGCTGGCEGVGWQSKDVPETRDLQRAITYFQKAIDQGAACGWTGFGWAYRFGQGVPVDQMKALSSFEKACEGGCAGGCEGLGWQHKDVAETRDFAKALVAFQKGVDGGSVGGWVGLARMYRDGQGVAANAAQSESYFKRACSMGNQDGCKKK